ncbi:MAG: hypothetical protein ACR2NZ_17990 [Rubripirellula sp.]
MIAEENVVVRLKKRLRQARSAGFRVRMDVLDDEQASWCVIGGIPTLFVDLSQTASEQLQQVEETLAAYLLERQKRSTGDMPDGGSESNAKSMPIPPVAEADPQNRAA